MCKQGVKVYKEIVKMFCCRTLLSQLFLYYKKVSSAVEPCHLRK